MASPLPTDARDRKRIPLVTGCWDYFAAALAEVARVSLAGNEQHHPGEPLHHERGKSADHADALGRHLVDRGTFDTDGHRHSAKVAWRALALLQEELEAAGAPLARGARLPEASTPTSETAAAMREALAGGLQGYPTLASALSSVPCAECTKRDANGECSAQCVREEGAKPASPAAPEATGELKDCVSCGHSADDGTVYPCRPCLTEFRRAGSFPNWTPAPPAPPPPAPPPPPMRECATCRHNPGGPCISCRYWSHWEPEP